MDATGISNPKRIAFQNAGLSTSKTDRGSDEEQVEFIREFYRVLHQYYERIEYAPIHQYVNGQRDTDNEYDCQTAVAWNNIRLLCFLCALG